MTFSDSFYSSQKEEKRIQIFREVISTVFSGRWKIYFAQDEKQFVRELRKALVIGYATLVRSDIQTKEDCGIYWTRYILDHLQRIDTMKLLESFVHLEIAARRTFENEQKKKAI